MASERAMVEMWIRMAEAFGEHWTRHYGEAPTSTWRAGLEDLDDADVAAGLLATIRGTSTWPPTLPEFHSRCVAHRRERQLALPAPAVPDVPLECMRPQSLVMLAVASGIDIGHKTRDELLGALRQRGRI